MGRQPEHNLASVKTKFKMCSVWLVLMLGDDDRGTKYSVGSGSVQETRKYHVGLVVVSLFRTVGDISELEVTDNQCNTQRGTESENAK